MNGAFKCNTFTQNAARNCNAQRSLRLVSCRVQAATLQHPSVSAGSQVQQQFGSPAPQAGATSFNLDWTFPLLTPEECKALLQSPKTCVVLDVRNKDVSDGGGTHKFQTPPSGVTCSAKTALARNGSVHTYHRFLRVPGMGCTCVWFPAVLCRSLRRATC